MELIYPILQPFVVSISRNPALSQVNNFFVCFMNYLLIGFDLLSSLAAFVCVQMPVDVSHTILRLTPGHIPKAALDFWHSFSNAHHPSGYPE